MDYGTNFYRNERSFSRPGPGFPPAIGGRKPFPEKILEINLFLKIHWDGEIYGNFPPIQ